MSRSFNGSSQALQSATSLADLAGATRIAMAFWLKSTFASDDDMIAELSATANSNAGTFRVLGNESGAGRFKVGVRGDGGYAEESLPSGVPSSATWHHILWNADFANPNTSEVETVYVDGAAEVLTDSQTFENTGTFGNYVLNLMSRNAAALFADGDLADVCIWRIEDDNPVTVEEVALLAGGARAVDVRPDDIAYYWPLAGEDSPEPALIGGTALTLIGAPTGSDDPPGIDPVPGLAAFEGDLSRTSDTSATITWDEPFGADFGVTVLRVPILTTEDGSGDEFGDPGYDPTTISGATVIATGETSPYVDATLDADTAYTYFLIRTGPDA